MSLIRHVCSCGRPVCLPFCSLLCGVHDGFLCNLRNLNIGALLWVFGRHVYSFRHCRCALRRHRVLPVKIQLTGQLFQVPVLSHWYVECWSDWLIRSTFMPAPCWWLYLWSASTALAPYSLQYCGARTCTRYAPPEESSCLQNMCNIGLLLLKSIGRDVQRQTSCNISWRGNLPGFASM